MSEGTLNTAFLSNENTENLAASLKKRGTFGKLAGWRPFLK